MMGRAKKTVRSRGYTVVELMMAVAVFAVGITGIVAMQTVAAAANTHAKNLAVATSLARSWQDRLSMDATLWGGPQEWTEDNMIWVDQVTANNNAWILPAIQGDFGPAAGPRGEFVDHANDAEDVVFCTHLRLTRLLDEPGSGLIRSEVRVFWPKGPQSWDSGDPYCVSNAADIASIGSATDQFHFVYKTTAVRETPSF